MRKQTIHVVETINSVLFVNFYTTDKIIVKYSLTKNNRVKKRGRIPLIIFQTLRKQR